MTVVVADKTGIVASAVRTGLRMRKIDPEQVRIVTTRTMGEIESAVRGVDRVVVVSAQLVFGLKSETELARRIKVINPNAIFIVYNGVRTDHGHEVDGRIPPVRVGENHGLWVLDHLMSFLGDGVPLRQASLFG